MIILENGDAVFYIENGESKAEVVEQIESGLKKYTDELSEFGDVTATAAVGYRAWKVLLEAGTKYISFTVSDQFDRSEILGFGIKIERE